MSETRTEFVEEVARRLVTPIRRVAHAFTLHAEGDHDGVYVMLGDIQSQLRELREVVSDEADRHVHTCSCGHTHYRQGERA